MDRGTLLQSSVAAARSLRANLHTVPGSDGTPRTVLCAGSRQYRSVWTRDFCFAAGGLLAAGETKAVRDTLGEIIAHQREDGLFPRLLDSMGPCLRFARSTLGFSPALKAPLKPNYLSDHLVDSVDTNSLVAWTAARYALRTGNLAWAGLVFPKLERGMDHYHGPLHGGLVRQPGFSDWKDTVARRGVVFFTQLLRWRAMRSLAELCRALGRDRAAQTWTGEARICARKAQRAFWDEDAGFFVDTHEHRLLSAEGNLAAAAWGFADERQAARIVRAMDRLELWTPWGPRAGQRYPLRAKGWLALAAGLSGYHDDFVWLWTSALAMRTLHKLGRTRMLSDMAGNVAGLISERGVSEVYRPEDGREVRTWIYRSERPFSWSAGMLLEAFQELAASSPEGPPCRSPSEEALATGAAVLSEAA